MKRLVMILIVLSLMAPTAIYASDYVLGMLDSSFPAEANLGTDTLLEDEDYYFVNLPFQVPFYCGSYNWVFIHANGILTLGDRTTHSYLFFNDQLPYMALDYPELESIPVISPYWTDIITSNACKLGNSAFYYDGNPANVDDQDNCYYVLKYEETFGTSERNGNVWYRVDETSSPRKLIVTWDKVYHWVGYNDLVSPPTVIGEPNTTGNSFQVVIYEDGRIQFNYGAMGWTGLNTNGYEATIGVGSGNPDNCGGTGLSTPAYEFYPADTAGSLVQKKLWYLFDTDGDLVPDDGNASGCADVLCQNITAPRHWYKPPVFLNCDDSCPTTPNPTQSAASACIVPEVCVAVPTPDGDLDVDGDVDIADAMTAVRIAVGLVTASQTQLDHGDVMPAGAGDGKIDMSDAMMIMRIASGVVVP